jgi:tRNA-specific 2-thiouridylase
MKASGLNNVLFPLGMLKKSEVRNLVQERFAGLEVLTKPESMGICFIGKRSLPDFLGNYMTFKHGRYRLTTEMLMDNKCLLN